MNYLHYGNIALFINPKNDNVIKEVKKFIISNFNDNDYDKTYLHKWLKKANRKCGHDKYAVKVLEELQSAIELTDDDWTDLPNNKELSNQHLLKFLIDYHFVKEAMEESYLV